MSETDAPAVDGQDTLEGPETGAESTTTAEGGADQVAAATSGEAGADTLTADGADTTAAPEGEGGADTPSAPDETGAESSAEAEQPDLVEQPGADALESPEPTAEPDAPTAEAAPVEPASEPQPDPVTEPVHEPTAAEVTVFPQAEIDATAAEAHANAVGDPQRAPVDDAQLQATLDHIELRAAELVGFIRGEAEAHGVSVNTVFRALETRLRRALDLDF